jgi:hypothetical protein
MAVRMTKHWRPLIADEVAGLAGHLGVYQLGNAAGDIVQIGCADARTRFGLRGVLQDALAEPPLDATCFRTESTMAYRTRYMELLQVYLHDHAALPPGNQELDLASLGVLRPD